MVLHILLHRQEASYQIIVQFVILLASVGATITVAICDNAGGRLK